MTTPAVVNENSSSEAAGDVTTHTVSLPASLVSGNLIVIVVAIDGNSGTVTPPTGFSNIVANFGDGVNAVFNAAWYKISDGSEGATTTFATVNAQRSAHHCWQISGHDSATNIPQGSSVGSAGSPSTTPDPASLTPTGGAKDYLWLAVSGKDTGDSTYSGFPTNYTNTGEINMAGATAAGVCLAWGRRALNAASEDPGAFTIAETEEWVAMTLAIHPGAASGTVNTNTLESTIVVTDQPLDYVFFNRVAEDAITLFDELIAVVTGILTKILSSTIDMTDGAVMFFRRTRLLEDTIVITEGTTERYITTNMLTEDTLDVIDQLTRFMRYTRLASDSVVLTDEAVTSIIGYLIFSNVLTSQLTVTDELIRQALFTRLAESSIDLTDGTVRQVLFTRLLESLLTTFDEKMTACQRFIMLSDALSMDDSLVATYVPDGGPVTPTTDNPVIRIGFDQPRIVLGGYSA